MLKTILKWSMLKFSQQLGRDISISFIFSSHISFATYELSDKQQTRSFSIFSVFYQFLILLHFLLCLNCHELTVSKEHG